MAEDYANELVASGSGLSLHEHQVVGLKKILQWHGEKHGGIVADEMGLGKTCQAVATIVCLLHGNKTGRHMVICPLSVLNHWRKELSRFGLGKLQVVKYIGDADAREALREKLQNTGNWNVLLTTYEMVIIDAQYFHWKWSSFFVDEAHRLKSKKSVLHNIVRKMPIEFMVLLTGTPVQNNLNELYSLLSLVDVNKFPLSEEDQFVAKYENTSDEQVTADLQQLLSKYLIRRTKKVLRVNLPQVSEFIVYHGMTDLQKDLYRAILSKNYQYFEGMDDKKMQAGNKMSLLNVLMQLRKCVAHPYLFDGVEPEPFEEGDHLYEASGKLFLLHLLLVYMTQKGHRVLIFSQMTRMLDIVQDYLNYRGYTYQRLDGSARAEERFASISRFQGSSEIFCFLLSTRAGGLGLNLTGADTVIFLDSDFNPQNDIQAAARCHRIGQTKPVKVIRLVARYTVEDMIICRAARKLRMTEQILEDSGDAKKDLTAAEISDLIIKGLNRLNEQKTDLKGLSVREIEKMIGKTDKSGYWADVEGEKQIESTKKPEAKKEAGSETENMYVFEGHDYKQDLAILQNIVDEKKAAAQQAEDSLARIRRSRSPAAPLERRTRKPLTKEEIEERQRKRQETLERKEKLRKEEAERKKREKEARKAMKWLKNDYKSGLLPLPEEEELQDDESGLRCGPHFVYGTLAATQRASSDNSDHALVVHVVDDSGRFGRGGVFDVLVGRNSKVADTYNLAGRMDDLHIGDAHVVENIDEDIPITPLRRGRQFRDENENGEEAEQSTSTASFAQPSKWKISVVLLVAQQEGKRDVLDQGVLAKCLKRLALYAVNSGARSVHMPRIGFGKENISWYVIERLISRILVSKGIHSYVYYFNRRESSIASSTDTTDGSASKRPGTDQASAPEKRRRVEVESNDGPESDDE